MLQKTCKGCGQTKPLDAFYSQKLGKHGRTARCQDCLRLELKTYYHTRSKRWERYGLTKETRDILLSRHPVCEVCGGDFTGRGPVIDHDHAHPGTYRGVVCHPCNAVLGFAQDDVRRLEQAIQYLKEKSQ